MKNINKFILTSLSVLAITLSVFAFGGNTQAFACSASANDCYPPLDASCYANVSQTAVGSTVTWSSSISGGDGYYSYYWSGSDGLVATTPNTSFTYSTAGTKTVSVEVTSNYHTVTRTCSVYIQPQIIIPPSNPSISGYCQGVSSGNNQITWQAYPTGGNGNYTYSWSGDASGSGQSVYQTYGNNNGGTKYAYVNVYSNGQSTSFSCNAYLNNNNNYNNYSNLSAYCVATPSNPGVNQSVTWTAYPTGGNGNYTYYWSGDADGYGQTSSRSYTTSGPYLANLRVNSNGQQVNVNCSTNVQGATGGIYLTSIPATGISLDLKTSLFLAGIVLWSAFLGYLFIARRNEKLKEKALLESLK